MSAMRRWLWALLCTSLGLGLVLSGFLVPIHLRAIDSRVLERAGKKTLSGLEQGLSLAKELHLGAAEMFFKVAQTQQWSGREKLGMAIGDAVASRPSILVLGGPEPRIETLFVPGNTAPGTVRTGAKALSEPVSELLVREKNRAKALELLRGSPRGGVQELLRTRGLTNTFLLPPSSSSSGQAFDTAVALSGLLLELNHLSPGLSNELVSLAFDAFRGGHSQRYEQALLDVMSLGQRLDWNQLTEFVSPVSDVEGLRLLAALIRRSESDLPVLFCAVQITRRPVQLTTYLMNYSESGMNDLGAALRLGTGAVKELLQRDQRIYYSRLSRHLALDYCWLMPWFALALKWSMYFAGGFFLALAGHFLWPRPRPIEAPLYVRGFHTAREALFGLGFLAIILLVTEPFLSLDTQRINFPFRLQLPVVQGAVVSGLANVKPSIMNQISLLTLLLFFVLQALIYTACVVKLAEIQRQMISARLKLRLLENEDHLFDAGLYLGFVGTIISLILVSLGVIKPSLMAAYSSTSFGIIFVSIFKIFHLRPARRKLVLESEANPESSAPTAAPRLATS